MSLWGNLDNPTGNQKPVFANTTNVQSNSTIHGTSANTANFYGPVFGVSATEKANTTHGDAFRVTHAGWVAQKIGTGPIASVKVTNGGQGINATSNVWLTLTDGSILGTGTGGNITFQIANAQNTLQSYSSNAYLNTIVSVTVTSGGSGYSNSAAITIGNPAAFHVAPTLDIVLGGRGDRVNYETIVAMGSITGDDVSDNSTFFGV